MLKVLILCILQTGEDLHTERLLSPTDLVGEELHYQVTFSLNFRRTRSMLQLKPGVIAAHWDLLQEGNQPD